MANSQSKSENGTSTVWQIVGRLIAAAVVLAITAFFTPGFSINNIWTLIIAAVVLTVIDYLVIDGKIMDDNLKALGKNREWLKKQVEKFKMKPEEALVVTYDGKGQIFCQKKGI